MRKRIGVMVAVVALALLIWLPVAIFGSTNAAEAQSPFNPGAFTQSIINSTFDVTFGSPSQSQYNRPVVPVPQEGQQELCANVVQNGDVPFFVQSLFASLFGLPCEPSGGSFFGLFFGV